MSLLVLVALFCRIIPRMSSSTPIEICFPTEPPCMVRWVKTLRGFDPRSCLNLRGRRFYFPENFLTQSWSRGPDTLYVSQVESKCLVRVQG